MSSRPPCKYDATIKALLRLHSDFAVLADDPETVEEWVDEFLTHLETVFALGAHIGVDAGKDAQVAAFLRNVRAHLLPHATEAWLEHSPRVVAGMEEKLWRRAAAPFAVPVLALIITLATPRPSPVPLQDDFVLLLEYSQRVKVGMMSKAEFEAHKMRVLTTGQRPRSSVSPAVSVAPPPSSLAPSPLALGAIAASSPTVSPSLSVVPPPSSQVPSPFQPSAPLPTASGTSAPSPLLFSTVVPSIPGPLDSATAPALSQHPICCAMVVTAASLFESPPAHWFSVKHTCSVELMDTSSIPGYIRCDYCTRNKPCITPTTIPAHHHRKLVASTCVSAVPVLPAAPAPLPMHASDAVFTLLAGGVIDRANALLFWRAELSRALSACTAANGYVEFVQAQYADLLGEVVALTPGPSASGPAPKRVRTGTARKGKGKAHIDAMEEDEEVAKSSGPANAVESKEGPGEV
ncbi:hypothetical protein BJY52DRAFT_1187551 [Lactarius psammicola]|nr:hypothetical protein BJY52DRAFT_1187551 [Lactarius psammicola]